jgi:hypothetical protein
LANTDLTRLAKRYIWWLSPAEAMLDPHHVMAQVMNIGTVEDCMSLRALVDDDDLRMVLREARPGEFSDRSWHYWHQMLGESGLAKVPELPVRTFG